MEGKFTLIQPEKEFIVHDNIKGFYAKLEQTDIQQCKRIRVKELICKQNSALFSSLSSTDCEVLMLQPIRLIPKSCSQKIIELKDTLWILLRDNAWIYVAPVPERLTVLCTGQRPADVEITGSGVLTFLAACTSGLGVACWPLVPKFAGSNLAEAVGFLRAKKSSARLPSEGK